MEERAKFEKRAISFQMVIDDIYAFPRVGWWAGRGRQDGNRKKRKNEDRGQVLSGGRTGFFFDDQRAINTARWRTAPLSRRSGDKGLRVGQATGRVDLGDASDGGRRGAFGDSAAVQYSGCGGRDPLFLARTTSR
jgi:hypothetical protein